jgi:hypothetical protein
MATKLLITTSVAVTLFASLAACSSQADDGTDTGNGAFTGAPSATSESEPKRIAEAWAADNDAADLVSRQLASSNDPMAAPSTQMKAAFPTATIDLFTWHAHLKNPTESVDYAIVEATTDKSTGAATITFYRATSSSAKFVASCTTKNGQGLTCTATPPAAAPPAATRSCDKDGPVCAFDLSNTTGDEGGMLFNCQNHVLTPSCLCQVSATTGQLCQSGACTCAVGDPMPTQVGSCVDTEISFVDGSGGFVAFTNGGMQITIAPDNAIAASQVGDQVHVCLFQLPQNCPKGDTRGKVYKTTNMRLGLSWTQADATHLCGGA